MTTASVLDRARALTAEANRVREGAAAEDNAKRVLTQAESLSSALEQLRRLVEAARALHELGGDVDAGRVDDGREKFSKLAADGLPSVQAITAARRNVETVLQRVQSALTQAWSQWTRERIAELPVQRLSVLSAADQRTERTTLNDLKKLAKIESPHAREIASFATGHAGLRTALEDLREPDPELERLLSRLSQRVTLDVLSDADIALLREYGLADQIELHRRGL
ncbi:hypothetical protein Dvina_01740 [Dactylosporangium vinaceum]|uniref:Uncharacterized protein n=1 Tax=Dactylosporangium vinaceum TaxID=53362 RepID=A0ABV5MLH6_9ACTN|nr:hypothetical protein [Dactylosporangium vinaceum]UAB96971.1 hypothetical protein Dvina_01740 [Dactylosporangium vinaceum]